MSVAAWTQCFLNPFSSALYLTEGEFQVLKKVRHIPYSRKIWRGINLGSLADLCKSHQIRKYFSNCACVLVRLVMYMHNAILEAKLQVG